MDEANVTLARDALETVAEAVAWSAATNAIFGGSARAATAIASLRARMVPVDVPNPAYACGHETAAALVLLAATDPERFARMTSGVFVTGIPPLGTVEGLERLDGFLGAVADDNDYCIVETDGEPRIVNEGTVERFVPTLDPATLLAALEPLLETGARRAP